MLSFGYSGNLGTSGANNKYKMADKEREGAVD